jgi:chorismate mutase/prephenate dehydratase
MTAIDAERRIAALRGELEHADLAIVEAVSRRQRIVETIAAVKQQMHVPLRNPAQETLVLERCDAAARQLGADPFLVGRIFRELIAHAVRVQEFRTLERGQRADAPLRIGFQGTDGAYSQAAAVRHFSPARETPTYTAWPTFRDLMQAVVRGDVDFGVLPIENSTAGSINETYDLLSAMELSIVGEEVLSIAHCLIGIEARPPATLRRIYSHPQALAQCSNFLATLPDCDALPFANTALAVEKVQHDHDPEQAAIGSEDAAQRFGLVVLARGIANDPVNLTRFVVVGREPIECGPGVPCKTSIVFVARHEQGTLLHCLNALAERGLNLSKLESRPRSGVPWEYQFYADFDGNSADPAVQEALVELRRRSLMLRVLGSYPSRTAREARVERVPAAPRER